MSKETSIVFVYDTKKLQCENDDPATAILYFHPTWVSNNQKTVLCGQLMGMIHCLRRVLDVPEIITLESGKFCVNFNENSGRYLLAVGTDRNVPDWVLRHRRNLLSSLIKFYHDSIETMETIYGNTDGLNAKIYHVFETYLKIVSFSNIFSVVPTISLPKSGSNVFIETVNILQHCQTFEHVLSGLVLYHNKVVATQISSELTKLIVLSDPYRIKSPAENVATNFQLPLGVQLLYVHITRPEYEQLLENSMKLKRVFQNLNGKKDGAIPTQFSRKLKMKRDCSLLFTSVPEEDTTITLNDPKKPVRPKFLPLKNKTTELNGTTTKVYTPLLNPGSVISTPMTELNKILHVNTYSIVTDPEAPELVKNKPDVSNVTKRERSNSLGTFNETMKVFKRRASINDPCYVFNASKVTNSELNALRKELMKLHKRKYEHDVSRKSLSLPLKSFDVAPSSDVSGLLTPLMQKLSYSSGFGSSLTTPSFDGFKRVGLHEELVKCALYVLGQADTVLCLLIKEECVHNSNLINEIWEICTEKLNGLEKQLNSCLEPHSGHNTSVQEQEPYSFLQLDSQQWNTVKKGGAWGVPETVTLMKLHRDFVENPGITEILCKGNESILFGVNNHGDSEIYYNQSECNSFGLPTPSDSMGHVPMRAKRSLERDHSIVLL